VVILRPERPAVNGAEHTVWDQLRKQLRDSDTLMPGVRVTDRQKDHEADVVVLLPGAGVVVVEVKGGRVWHDGNQWWQKRGQGDVVIEPVRQVRQTKYALREFVERDPRWKNSSRSRVRWAHAVAVPNTELAEDFETPDCPRWSIVDRTQMGELAAALWDVPAQQESGHRPLTDDDAALIADILRGRGLSHQDQLADSDEREAESQRLTQEQAGILTAIQLLPRVEVRGGAGSGKTWLALEQARRLTQAGLRVALLCYSRGLSTYLQRQTQSLKYTQRPAYVGSFHNLGVKWGAAVPDEAKPEYWENELPAQMLELAEALPANQRFDAVVIDEAQDFADAWWPVILAALTDPSDGRIYAFSDEGQRVFARFGEPPVPLIPIVLEHNLRNTRQIAESFSPLTSMRMKLFGGDGPDVRFVPCTTEDALSVADDEVDTLLDTWRPEDVALLATGHKHPEHAARQEDGQDAYWESFWDKDQVFYGHVIGFKGLERRVVVLAVNETKINERSRERLYVGLSRARDQLVVCGDPAVIEQVAGAEVLKRLTSSNGSK
jgi:ATP:corrinoid adenosyltransferase